MKILLMLIMLPTALLAQEIPKGVTKVIITNELSAKENYDHAVQILLDNDHFFERRDSTIGYLQTQLKKMKGFGLYFLNVRAKDNKIEISGLTKLGADISIGMATINDDPDPIRNVGGKGSLFKKAFTEMDLIGSKFKGSKGYE